MVSSGIKVLLLCAVTLAVIQHTNCQISIIATGIQQIVSLLENVTKTSTTMSSILPQLANSLQSQEQNDLQTNTILQNQQNTTDRMETTLTQMASKQTATMAIQTQLADALTMIVNTQSQMANTQSQMNRSLGQMATQLQIQSQQLGNISVSLTSMVNKLNKQNNILEGSLDCSQVTSLSGLYKIYPEDDLRSFQVYCDMDTDGGGWIVFQRRFDGSVDFFLGWKGYEKWFGNMLGEHWLGLQKIHRLTRSGQWTLRIDMEDFNGNTRYAQYRAFEIGDADSFYQLSIGSYSGTVGFDSLAPHNGKPYSTKDSDHDTFPSPAYNGSCALAHQGAWWYHGCVHSNLNGLYGLPESNYVSHMLMSWLHFSERGSGWTRLKKSEMKIRRIQ